MDTQSKNSLRCDNCDIDVHRGSFIKHLRSKKHLENIKQDDMIIPEWLFEEPIENKTKKNYIILNLYENKQRKILK